jgi:hypothetical protein
VDRQQWRTKETGRQLKALLEGKEMQRSRQCGWPEDKFMSWKDMELCILHKKIVY